MTTPPRRRRLRPTRIVAALFLLVPIIEIMALIAVGRAIGGWPTFFLLVAMSVLGAWLMRREGSRAWRALQDALQSGRMPARELADGMLVLIGGTLLLTPGFLTDIAGFFLVLPFTRPVARRLVETVIARRLVAQVGFIDPRRAPGQQPGGRAPGQGDVIEGEIVDE